MDVLDRGSRSGELKLQTRLGKLQTLALTRLGKLQTNIIDATWHVPWCIRDMDIIRMPCLVAAPQATAVSTAAGRAGLPA